MDVDVQAGVPWQQSSEVDPTSPVTTGLQGVFVMKKTRLWMHVVIVVMVGPFCLIHVLCQRCPSSKSRRYGGV